MPSPDPVSQASEDQRPFAGLVALRAHFGVLRAANPAPCRRTLEAVRAAARDR